MSLIKNVADMAAEMAALDGTTAKAMEDAMGLEYEDRVAAVAGAVDLTPGVGGQSWADIRYRWMAREQAMKLVFNTALRPGVHLDGSSIQFPTRAISPTNQYAESASSVSISGIDAEILFRLEESGSGWSIWLSSVVGVFKSIGTAFYVNLGGVQVAFTDAILKAASSGWVKIEVVGNNGSGNSSWNAYTAADSATVPTSWTLRQSLTGATFSSTTARLVRIGASAFANERFQGSMKRVILKSGIDGTTVFDANFASQPANIYSFTESSSNAATVTLTSTHNLVTLPLGGTVNVNIDWGDGTSDIRTVAGNFSHRYPALGTYNVSIRGSMTQFGATGAFDAKLVACHSFGIIGVTSLLFLINGLRDAPTLTVAPKYLPSTVVQTGAMFVNCSLFNSDIGGWDVSNVTQMPGMFQSASSFNQDIGGWDVSSVTNMLSMFSSATAFNQDIGGWDVGRVTTMNSMLFGATSFNQNLGGWRPSQCTNFNNWLFNVTLSTANYDALLTGWTDFTGTGWNTGSITAFADAGGGQVTVTTSAAHGYANNHVMRITDTTNYDGSYVISNVTSTTFRITATFVATETGTWNATLQSGVTFGGGNSQYSVGAATTARGVLTGAPYNWTITDGGQA